MWTSLPGFAATTMAVMVSVLAGGVRGESLRLPDGFLIGAGTSAYQIEGAWNASGKGMNSLDRAYGKRIDGGGNVACDSYHRYKEDVAMLKLMGATHYRFSLSWARILPTGRKDDVNPDGVRFYNDLLDELERNSIEPVVTLYHMDVPVALDDRFQGWLSPEMVEYFEEYAEVAFTHFGGRVKYWVTLNEPYMFCVFGVGHGRLGAPAVRPGTGEYLCGHHMLLAHARAYRLYQARFRHHGGVVGLSLQSFFTGPNSEDPADVSAAEAHQLFELGWFLDPLLLAGAEYPAVMRAKVPPSRLPSFTEEEKAMISGSLDFLGLNVYFGWTARFGVPDGATDPSIERDAEFIINGTTNQFQPPGPFRSTPWALRASLRWFRERYGDFPVILTENGFGDSGEEALHDQTRVEYLRVHLREVLLAVHEDKHDIRGYFVWSLLDDFEWGIGYKSKFGVVHVDFESGSLNRTAKQSLFFLRDVIARGELSKLSSAAQRHGGRGGSLILVLATLVLLGLSGRPSPSQ